MKKQVLFFLLLVIAAQAVFLSRELFAKNPIFENEDFFVDSSHLPLEEDFE